MLDAIGEAKPAVDGTDAPENRRQTAGESYFEALSAVFNRGWAPPARHDARRTEVHRSADPGALQPSGRPRRAEEPRLRGARTAAAPAQAAPRAAPGSTSAGPSAPRRRPSLRSLGYLAVRAGSRTSYGPADDPKTLIDVDQAIHRYVDLHERKKYDEAILNRQARSWRENPKMQLGYMHLAAVLQPKDDLPGALRTYEQAADERRGGREHGSAARASSRGDRKRPKEAVAALEPYRESDDPETLNAPRHRARRCGTARGCASGLRAGSRDRPVQRAGLPEHGHRALEARSARGSQEAARSGARAGEETLARMERARSRIDAAGRSPKGDRRLAALHRAQPRAVRRALQHRPGGRAAGGLEARARGPRALRRGGSQETVRAGSRRGARRARRHDSPGSEARGSNRAEGHESLQHADLREDCCFNDRRPLRLARGTGLLPDRGRPGRRRVGRRRSNGKDVRVDGDRIVEVGKLAPKAGERVVHGRRSRPRARVHRRAQPLDRGIERGAARRDPGLPGHHDRSFSGRTAIRRGRSGSTCRRAAMRRRRST